MLAREGGREECTEKGKEQRMGNANELVKCVHN